MKNVTPQFTEAFISTCFEQGLTKEATAELLQKESADQVKRNRGLAFAQGYDKAAAEFPGNLRPTLTFEKSAVPIMKALGAARKGIGEFIKKRPKTTVGVGVGGAAGITGVLHGLRTNLNRGLDGMSDLHRDYASVASPVSPFMSPSGYDPKKYEENYKKDLYDNYGPGIAASNKAYFGPKKRIAELEAAVASHKGGAAAYHELQQLKAQVSEQGAKRESHFSNLDRAERHNRKLLADIEQRAADLQGQKGSWLKNKWLSLTGRNPDTYYKDRFNSLHENASRARIALRTADDRRRMLTNDYRSQKTTEQPTNQQIQERFFPTF